MICIEPQYFGHNISQFPIDAVQIFLAFPFPRVFYHSKSCRVNSRVINTFSRKKGYTVDFVEIYRVLHLRHLSNLLHQERHFSLFASVFFAEQEAQIASETRVVEWKMVFEDVFSPNPTNDFPPFFTKFSNQSNWMDLLNQISIL